MYELTAGYLADLAFGDPRRFHPVAWFGTLAAALEKRLYQSSRSAGLAHLCFMLALAVAGTAAPRRALARLGNPAAHLFGVAAVWSTIGARSLAREGQAMAALLEAGELSRARVRLRALCGRNPQDLDLSELSRATIESVAENTADAVCGPLFWAALFGPTGASLYRASNTLDAMVGHRCERYLSFGFASARLDDWLTWPAARLCACLAVLAAPLVGGDVGSAAAAVANRRRTHPSPNAGLVEAAFAGAIGVRLGGPTRYGNRVEHRPAFGAGRACNPADIAQAVRLSLICGAACCVLAAGIAWGRER